MQGGNNAAAGGDQIGNKKGTNSDSDGRIPVKAVAEGIVTSNTATDIDSSGILTVPWSHSEQCQHATVLHEVLAAASTAGTVQTMHKR